VRIRSGKVAPPSGKHGGSSWRVTVRALTRDRATRSGVARNGTRSAHEFHYKSAGTRVASPGRHASETALARDDLGRQRAGGCRHHGARCLRRRRGFLGDSKHQLVEWLDDSRRRAVIDVVVEGDGRGRDDWSPESPRRVLPVLLHRRLRLRRMRARKQQRRLVLRSVLRTVL
jgi:hypothetical protein